MADGAPWYRLGDEMVRIPNGWDCFQWCGWLWRRGPESFYREKYIGGSEWQTTPEPRP